MFAERKPTTHIEHEAEKMFKQREFAKPVTDHERAQRALHENLDRLRAERRSREDAARGTKIDPIV
jgi:hypothetical protein